MAVVAAFVCDILQLNQDPFSNECWILSWSWTNNRTANRQWISQLLLLLVLLRFSFFLSRFPNLLLPWLQHSNKQQLLFDSPGGQVDFAFIQISHFLYLAINFKTKVEKKSTQRMLTKRATTKWTKIKKSKFAQTTHNTYPNTKGKKKKNMEKMNHNIWEVATFRIYVCSLCSCILWVWYGKHWDRQISYRSLGMVDCVLCAAFLRFLYIFVSSGFNIQ